MPIAQSRSTALAERLQRLKAGLAEKPSTSKPSLQHLGGSNKLQNRPSERPSTSTSEGHQAVLLGSGSSSRSHSEDYEHLASQTRNSSDPTRDGPGPEAQELKAEGTAGAAEEDKQDEFEMVSSPHEGIKAMSGSSPTSSNSGKGVELAVEIATPAQHAQSSIEELRQQLSSKDAQIADLTSSLAEEKEQKDDIVAQIRALRGAYTEARDSAELQSDAVERLQQECEDLREQLATATSASLRQARQEEASNVSNRLERAERAIEMERASVVRLENLLAESRSQARQSADAARQVESLQAKLASQQQAQAQQEREMQIQLSAQDKRAAKAEKAADLLHNKLNAALNVLQKERDTVQSLRTANEQLMKQIQQLSGELSTQEPARDISDLGQLRPRNTQTPGILEYVASMRPPSQMLEPDLPIVPPSFPSFSSPEQQQTELPTQPEDDSIVSEIRLNSPVKEQTAQHARLPHGERAVGHGANNSRVPEIMAAAAPERNSNDTQIQPAKLGLWAYITGADKAAQTQ